MVASNEQLAALRLGAAEWLNSPPLTPSSLAGKVVLVDFCTYTCINWLRTLPYVRAWAAKYRQGLVVIGVHTPEFAFERNLDNVRRAVQEMRIELPDRDRQRLRNLARLQQSILAGAVFRRWRVAQVREHHFGEGEYERSETIIQRAAGGKQCAGGG